MILKLIGRTANSVAHRLAERTAKKNPHIEIAKSARILSYQNLSCKSGNITIGKNTSVNTRCVIRTHHSAINIGKNVLIGPGTILHTIHHNFEQIDKPIKTQGTIEKPIIIEEDVWIGANCTILGGTKIGAHSVIGAHSLVKGNIPRYSVAYGVPCRVKRTRHPRKIQNPDNFYKMKQNTSQVTVPNITI